MFIYNIHVVICGLPPIYTRVRMRTGSIVATNQANFYSCCLKYRQHWAKVNFMKIISSCYMQTCLIPNLLF